MADYNKIRDEVNALTDRLEMGVQDLYTSDKYAAYLDTLAHFHNYSTRNTILIWMQMPDATRVAGFNTWKNRFERHVMKGQKGIRILAPAPYVVKQEKEKLDPETKVPLLDESGKPVVVEVDVTVPAFKPVSVFDVSQTDGKPLPSLVDDLTGNVQEYNAFIDALNAVSPMPIQFAPLHTDTDGQVDYEKRTIAIRAGISEIQTVSAIIHEMTHAELYIEKMERRENAQQTAPSEPDGAERKDQPLGFRAEEVVAESVSYVSFDKSGCETLFHLLSVTDTIDVFVYKGLTQLNDVGRASAAGFMQSIMGFVLVLSANFIVRKVDSDNALF